MPDYGKFTELVEGLDPGKIRRATARGRDPLVDTHPAGNPCVAVYGAGPAGVTCATCAHLHAITASRTWFKCDQRPITGGPGTDHRKGWPACAKYEEGAPQTHARGK